MLFRSFNAPDYVNATEEKDGGKSTNFYSTRTGDMPHMWDEFNFLKTVVPSHIEAAVEEWKLSKVPYFPAESWINEHKRGGWTGEHYHRGAYFVLVYYLSVPDGSGNLMVRDPLEYHWSGFKSMPDRGIDNMWYPLEVKAGDLLLFPGWIKHKTEASLSDESRYIMSINFDANI